jgi:tetratricopeptide (TPR) repeat protein
MPAALDFVNRSIDSNALNVRAQNLKAAVLRHLGRNQEAIAVLYSASHAADPLDVRAMAETYLASPSKDSAKRLASVMNDHPATAQETAAEYLNEGLWQDGADVLVQSTFAAPDKTRFHPMTYYYLGYFAHKLGKIEDVSRYYQLAMSAPPEYVFPFQSEAIDVLRWAIAVNPRDARAHYYLGNLLYDWQPEEATLMWQASAALDPSFAITHRNLAVAYMHPPSGYADENALAKAIAELEKAVSFQLKYPLHFTELDELYEQAGTPLEKRLQLFRQNASVVARRDDALNRALALEVATGQVDDAIRTMTTHTFAVAEGANLNVVEHWTEAHIQRAQTEIRTHHYKEALADLEAAATIPANLPVGFFGGVNARDSEIAYWTGVVYEGSGDTRKATESWQRAIAPPRRVAAGVSAQSYYQGLAFQKLGQPEKAEALFQSLLQSARHELLYADTRARAANAHYVAGLGYLGLKDQMQAKAELTQAVQISPDLVGARTALASLP